MSLLFNEIRNALRSILAKPTFSALIVCVLAAGLACVIFMLALINGFVIRPLPFSAPDQLHHVGLREDGGNDLNPVNNLDLIAIRRQLADVAETAAFARSTMNLSDLGRPERSSGAYVSSNLFRVLGIAPQLGRDFSDADAASGAAAVAMLSHELWQSRYGGDPTIVGKTIRINAQATSVIGVMPPNFSYPGREVIWVAAPLFDGAKADDLSWWVVVRQHADASVAAVDSAFANWFSEASRERPDAYRGMQAGVEPLAWMHVARNIRSVLNVMLAAVVMVLLVACANAANLLLTRTLGRRQELAVRSALGASRRRLVVHLFAECLLLSLIASAIALPLAWAGVRWQQAMMAQADFGPPNWLRFDIDATVVTFAVGAVLISALLTGLLSALRVGDGAVAADLRDGSRSVVGGAFARISRVLVIGEVALSCALLISVGTLVRGLSALDNVDLGIASEPLLTARVVLPTSAYPSAAEQSHLYQQLGDRLRADAGVVDASVGTILPGTNFNDSREIQPAGAETGDAALPRTHYGAVDDHFLATAGVALLQGRFFNAGDRADGVRVAVVDEGFAQRFGADGDLIGRQFRLNPRDPKAGGVTIVGVIGALKLAAPGDAVQPAMLVPLRQDPFRVASVLVRTHVEPNGFAPQLVEIMRGIDADTPLYWLRDYNAVIRSGTVGERSVAQSFSVFGVIALILAGAGLYGLVAFNVSQRLREIGVRRALGAPNHHILGKLFLRTGIQVGMGLIIGLAVGIPFSRLLTGSMQGLQASNVTIVLIVLVVLIGAAFIAVAIPARRALRIDPTVALRHE